MEIIAARKEILIISFISSYEITKVFLRASIAELAAVRPNRPSGFMTDFNNGSPVFNNGPRSLPKTPPD